MSQEFIEHLKNIPYFFDLHISVIEENENIMKLFKEELNGKCLIKFHKVQNVGRDIKPFFDVLSTIEDLDSYDAICKVHTKKSLHMSGGDKWRKELLELTLGPREKISLIASAFKKDPTLAMVGPQQYVLTKLNSGINCKMLHKYLKKLNYKYNDYLFFSGSMFWCSPKLISNVKEILDLDKNCTFKTKDKDGNLEHLIERSFGISAAHYNLKVKTIS